jgi:hypothetical protein
MSTYQSNNEPSLSPMPSKVGLLDTQGRTNIRSGWKEERTSSSHEMSSLTKALEACLYKQTSLIFLRSTMKSSYSPLQGKQNPPQQHSADTHESTLCECRSSGRIGRNWRIRRNWRITQMNQQSVYRHAPTRASALGAWQMSKDTPPLPTSPSQKKRNHER